MIRGRRGSDSGAPESAQEVKVQGGTEVVKSPKGVMTVEGSSKAVSKSDKAEGERSKSVPSAAEIRRRAFEICIERVGIDCSDLHDWLQAERELREKYKETAIGAKK
jgi:hypothetical protein